MKCKVCGHAAASHDDGGTHCKVCGETTCRVDKENEMQEPSFDTNKSLAVKGAMRGAAAYGGVPVSMLNSAPKCECGCSKEAHGAGGTVQCTECGCDRYKAEKQNGDECICGQYAREHKEECPQSPKNKPKQNSTFRFADTQGEGIEVEAVSEENAWAKLAAQFGLHVDEVKAVAKVVHNKGDDYSSLSDKQLKELHEHYENALEDHRRLGDAESANDLHECLMNIKAEMKKRGK